MKTFFWEDNWSPLGSILKKVGLRGVIDMGIPINTTMEEVMQSHQRRRHQNETFNEIEVKLAGVLTQQSDEADCVLWRVGKGKYGKQFNTKAT